MKIPFEIIPFLGGHVNFLLCGGVGTNITVQDISHLPTQSTRKRSSTCSFFTWKPRLGRVMVWPYIYIYIYCKNHGKKSANSSLRFCLGDVSTRLLPIQANALKIPEDFGGEIPNFLIHQRLLHHVLLFETVVSLQEIVIPALQFHSEWVYCTIFVYI